MRIDIFMHSNYPFSFHIASYPGRGNKNNPYVDLFYDALAPHDIELVDELKVDIDWLSEHRNRLDGIHFHWPELSWRKTVSTDKSSLRYLLSAKIPGAWKTFELLDRLSQKFGFEKTLQSIRKISGVIDFYRFIKFARKSGLVILWTFHNAESHEGNDYIDQLGYHLLARYVDLVIFHGQIAEKEYESRFKTSRASVIMPHGNYDGYYPSARPKKILLQELNLRDDIPIVSCLGMLRNYKGLDVASEAISILGSEVQFICVGWPHPSFDLESLQSKLEKLPNALLIPRFLSNQEFSDYVSLSDLILMPYNKITGSGALLAVLTLGRGVITSDLPYFREVLEGNPDAGRLATTGNAKDFAEKIRTYLKISPKIRSEAARKLAEQYDWEKVVVPVSNIIKNWNSHEEN